MNTVSATPSVRFRAANDRGLTSIGWLKSRHSFSFGGYNDPAHVRFRSLRVINDDVVAGGGGFDTHPHRDMEIISIVLAGALEHRDSMGNGEVLRPGEVQVMTAGRGIEHSEFNPSRSEPVHLLQIWIMPERRGLEPAYAQKAFDRTARIGSFQRVAGPVEKSTGGDGALHINQDAHVLLGVATPTQPLTRSIVPGRGVWAHAISGTGTINGTRVSPGDAVAIEGAASVDVNAAGDELEVVVFDLG